MKSTVALLGLVTLIGAHEAGAGEGSYLHDTGFVSFCVPGTSTCFNLDHTWAESLNTSCKNDAVQTFGSSGPGNCVCTSSTSASHCGCISGYNWQTSASDNIACGSFSSEIAACYKNSAPGWTYAVNGVCHEATNRALERTSVPWVESAKGPSGQTVQGAGAAHGIWGYCGASIPWGSQYSCTAVCG